MRFLRPKNWTAVSSMQVRDMTFGPPGILRTDVLYRHKNGERVKTKSIDGWWSLEDLRPRPDHTTTTRP